MDGKVALSTTVATYLQGIIKLTRQGHYLYSHFLCNQGITITSCLLGIVKAEDGWAPELLGQQRHKQDTR